tara:strand:- start:391 stop:597 length:207 start_codon:yes stop_codon:yes gene_type:complete
MPKIFKENKFALIVANIVAISIWLIVITLIKRITLTDNLPFYIYNLADLIRFVPPIWLTYYLWIIRKN